MATIAVHGTASRTLPAELTVAHLSVEITNDDRDAAIADATAVHSKIVTDVQRLTGAGAVTHAIMPPVDTWVTEQWVMPDANRAGDGLQQVIRHCAGGDIDVWFADSVALGAWLTELGKITGVNVRPVTWDISEATRREVVRALRAGAAQDAVARATDYSSALGLRYLHLSTLHEREDPDREPAEATHAKDRATKQTDPKASPRMIELSVTVDAEFSVE